MDYLIYQLSALDAISAPFNALPDAEQEEAVRRGTKYAQIRTVLRQELSLRTGVRPESIVFNYSQHGKPVCELHPFNISHSRDCLCLAFHHKDIGVDVEYMRPRPFASLAARFMSQQQLQDFMTKQCPIEDFYACWCAAEALVKHAGDTMWHAQQYPFVLKQNKIECLFQNAPVVELFSPMPGYRGAVAYSL